MVLCCCLLFSWGFLILCCSLWAPIALSVGRLLRSYCVFCHGLPNLSVVPDQFITGIEQSTKCSRIELTKGLYEQSDKVIISQKSTCGYWEILNNRWQGSSLGLLIGDLEITTISSPLSTLLTKQALSHKNWAISSSIERAKGPTISWLRILYMIYFSTTRKCSESRPFLPTPHKTGNSSLFSEASHKPLCTCL
jgi:hypothetical protein